MTLRVAKVSLIFAVALFYSFVVLNNLTDYGSDYQFVRHVLMMDTTFPGNRGMWRAINGPVWHTAVLCIDHRVGDGDHASVLVGRIAAGEATERSRRSV